MSIYDKLQQGGQPNLQQIQQDPIGMAKQAGYNIPPNLAGNPQAMVQHLIQTGQVGGPMMQKIMPMMQKLMGK